MLPPVSRTARTESAIAVLPYGVHLGESLATKPLDELNWPLGRPSRLQNGVVGDLTSNDHLIVYPHKALHFKLRWGTRAKVSIMVAEPPAIHGRHLKLLRWTWRRFHRVLSYNDHLLAAIPNGIKHPFGTSWIPPDVDLSRPKIKHMSLIASAKRELPGHSFRHEIVDFVQQQRLDVDILGHGYAPFEKKQDGLLPYQFSIVIENVQEPNFFTEKILDAVFCEAVPIYWGCPNIGEYFDPACMIICEDAAQMQAAITAATDAQYDAMLPALRLAKKQASHWSDYEGRAARAIQATL